MEPLKPIEERRNHARVAVLADYTLLLDGIEYSGSVGNISLGGVYLRNVEPLMTEASVFHDGDIALKLPGDLLRLRCNITYVGTQQSEHPKGVGAAFSDPDEQALAAIQSFIISRL